MLARTESQIVTAICQYLRFKRYYFWRSNNVGIWDQKRGAYRSNKNIVKGIADLFVLNGNQIVAVEVKSDSGRQTPEQKEFGAQFHTPPFRVYAVCRSIEDIIKLGL